MAMLAHFAGNALGALLGLLDPSRLTKLQADLIKRIVFTVEGEVKKVTPVKTGHLRRSITGDVLSVDRGRVGSNVIYAPIVDRRRGFMQSGLQNAQGTIDSLTVGFWSSFIGGG